VCGARTIILFLSRSLAPLEWRAAVVEAGFKPMPLNWQ
jgi:hypothetical protein